MRKLSKKNVITRSLRNNAKTFFKRIWGLISAVAVVLTIVVYYHQEKDRHQTASDKIRNENFWEGDLKPSKISRDGLDTSGLYMREVPPIFLSGPINDKLPKIKGILLKNFSKNYNMILMMGRDLIIFDKTHFLTSALEFNIPLVKPCIDKKLTIGVKDERLYVSIEFKDMRNEEIIGIIEFNHWKLFKNNTLYFKNDDERLEVRDFLNQIVFSIKYVSSPTGHDEIFISGYFVDPSTIVVLPNDTLKTKEDFFCFPKSDSSWRIKAQKQISYIKSVF